MSLEMELKQPRFISEHQKAMVNILYSASWLNQKSTSHLKKFNLTPEQFNVLRILRGGHPAPMRLADISGRMIEKNSNCTRLVEKLRLKGLVNRIICKNNRRQVDISLTPAGIKLLLSIDREYEKWLEALKSITRSEAQELNRILDKMRG